MTDKTGSCPVCGSDTPAGANYCPSCGLLLAHDTEPVASTSSPPRLFGVVSPAAAFVLACILLVGGLAAAFSGSIVLTIVLLAASAAVFVLFYGAAERDTSSAVARAVLAANDRGRAWANVAKRAIQAWWKAGRDVFRLRRELRALRNERQQLSPALGEAAFREDESIVASLRARMREIDEAVAERERARAEAVARAKSRVEDERAAGRPTQVLEPDEDDKGNGSPPS